jgi:hypothetical protein
MSPALLPHLLFQLLQPAEDDDLVVGILVGLRLALDDQQALGFGSQLRALSSQ